MKDCLMDILLDITTLLEQLTILLACPGSIAGDIGRTRLRNSCEEVESALNRWSLQFGTQILKFDYTVTGLPLPTPHGGAEFSLLHLSIMYWFIGMMLFSVKGLALNLSSPGDVEMIQVDVLARKCGRAIPLLFEASAGLSQNISGLMALSIAMRYFAVTELPGQQSEEARNLQALLKQRLAGTSVYRLLKRMNGGRDAFMGQGYDPKRTQYLQLSLWF